MKSPLRIAFFGSSLVSTFWNGAATYYRGIIRALAARGHHVTFFEPDKYDRQQHRDIPDPSWAEIVVYRSDSHNAALAAVQRAEGADVIIKASGVGVYDEILEAAVLDLKTPSNLVAFWDVHGPATLDRVTHNLRDAFRPLIPRFDLVLTYGGGPSVVAAYEALGATRCVPIYNALDPETHFPAPPDPHFASDLSFLGNRLPDREGRMEEYFFHAASLLPHRKFLLAGNGWNERPLPSNVTYVGHVNTKDHNAFNAAATAVLNVNRESMVRHGFSPPTRLFEAAGANACLITDAWDGLELFFEPGTEVLVARTGVEVADHLKSLDPARAARIGAAARARVLAHHTYAHRVAQLETVLDGQYIRIQESAHPFAP